MASNINSVTISGNITRDAENRAENVVTFSIAVNEQRKQGDEWKEFANYVDCVMFGKRADALKKFLLKGTKVFIHGGLRYSSWEKEGQKRSKLEVIVDDIDLASAKKSE